jgi:tellurite resistance protein TerC
MAAPGQRWSETITYKWARRIAVAVIGSTVCLIGIAMIVLPGPALVVIPLGLGILGLEFAWARRWLARVKAAANGLVDGMKGYYPWRKRDPGGPTPPSG